MRESQPLKKVVAEEALKMVIKLRIETNDCKFVLFLTIEEKQFCRCCSISETIAFTAALTFYSSIPDEAAVEFNVVLLNEGDG